MPRAPKKCANATCENRVQGKTYCPEHTPMNWTGHLRAGTAAHKTWRKQVLARDKGTCQINGPGCQHRALEADHIIPIAEGGAAHQLSNGQAVCVPCHKRKTQQEALRGKQRAKQGTPPPPPPGRLV